MKYLVFITIVAVLMQGCATSYQSSGYAGGFSSTQLDENVFRVSFRGNAYTGRDRVADFTLLRSAELALQNGYKHFSIISANEYTSNSSYTTPITSNTTASVYGTSNYAYGNATTTTYGGQTYNVSKPSSSNTIVCFIEKPETMFSYNAEFIVNSLSQQYGIKQPTKFAVNNSDEDHKRKLFQEKMNSLSKEVQANPTYKRIPLDTKQDQEWFATETFLYWDSKSTKEEFINNGITKFPEFRETFEYLSEEIKK